MVSFLIDAVLAVMLVTATVFLVIVNKRLKVLRSSQSEINTLVATFSRTIDETDASVKRLVGAATEISAKLSDELDRATHIKDDVALMLGTCERATKRIEESVQHARALVRRLEEGPRPKPRHDAAPPTIPSENAAREIEAHPVPDIAPSLADTPEDASDFRPLTLSAMVERTGAGTSTPPAPEPAAPPSAEPGRQTAVGAFYARLRTVTSET